VDAQILQEFILDLVRNPILTISLLTLFLSTINLWFSHLKGPDIELESDIIFEVEDWKNYRAENVSSDFKEHTLSILPIKMVFINNGSKSGAITKIEGEFIPEDWFKPFYKDSNFTNRVYNVEFGLPCSIGDGETRIIQIEGYIQTIDWTNDINPDIVKDTDQLRRDFFLSFEHTSNVFKEFVEYFDSKKVMGKIVVYVECSKKRLLSTKLRKTKVGESKLANNCVILSDALKEQLSSWDSELIASSRLQNVPGRIDQLLIFNAQNIERLKQSLSKPPLNQCFIFEDTIRNYKQQSNVIIDIMRLEDALMNFIEDLDRSTKRYNLNIGIIQTTNSNSEQLEQMNTERLGLLKLNEELHTRLGELKKKLA